jgi:glycosyltransferase involved in cell wall biosynthesis
MCEYEPTVSTSIGKAARAHPKWTVARLMFGNQSHRMRHRMITSGAVRHAIEITCNLAARGGEMPSIAVVLATFNGEKWLDTQLRSIAQQSRPPDRLVISDDGSTDRTAEIAHEFSKDAPFNVVLLEGPRTGLDENFWSAAKHANTDVIAWCDQDDFWHPQKLQICERLMQDNDAQLVSHSAEVADGSLAPTGRLWPRYRRTRVLEPLEGDPWWIPPGCTTLVQAELLQSVRWEERPVAPFHSGESRLDHDEVISLFAFATSRRLWVKDTLISYRQHEQNVAGAPKVQSRREQIRYALHIEPTQYSDRAEIADGYARFIAECDPQNTRAIHYFSTIAERCLRRSQIHQSANRVGGMHNLVTSLGKGDFGRKSHGGFGGLALARDAAALGLGANHDKIKPNQI